MLEVGEEGNEGEGKEGEVRLHSRGSRVGPARRPHFFTCRLPRYLWTAFFHRISLFIFKATRGQWPYRPASTRAVRNKQVMLYDFNYFGACVQIAYKSHSVDSEVMTASIQPQ